MRKRLIGTALTMAAAALPITAFAQAQGTPQRGDDVPPGLAKKLLDMPPGIARALEASEGSNSRLQDLPFSP